MECRLNLGDFQSLTTSAASRGLIIERVAAMAAGLRDRCSGPRSRCLTRAELAGGGAAARFHGEV